MPAPNQTSFPKYPGNDVNDIGDSLSFNCTKGTRPVLLWGAIAAKALNERYSCNCRYHNFGRSGTTTQNVAPGMLYRIGVMSRYGTPKVAIIRGGTNDTNTQAISSLTSASTTATCTMAVAHDLQTGDSATVSGANQSGYNGTFVVTVTGATTFTYTLGSGQTSPATGTLVAIVVLQAKTILNLQCMIRAVAFGVGESAIGQSNVVYSQTSLPAAGNPNDRWIVQKDTSTTGGAAATPWQTTTLTGSVSPDINGNQIAVWEYRNGQAGEPGWGRVAINTTTPDKCPRILVIGQHYLNWSTGGDTLSVPYAPWAATNPGLRYAQIQAAAAEGAVYGDLYNFLRTRIANGIDTQGSFTYHFADLDLHQGPYGHTLDAQFLVGAINAQSGWAAALSV